MQIKSADSTLGDLNLVTNVELENYQDNFICDSNFQICPK